MRGLSGRRWGLWLALLAILVLTSGMEASADTTPPSVPTGLTAWPASCSQINLAWNASTDAGGSGLWAYNVYAWRSNTWAFLKQVLAPATSTSDVGLNASTPYYYSVQAVDKAGNASAQSPWASATTVVCATLGGACSAPTIIPSQGGTFSGVTSGSSTLGGTCGSTGTSPEKVFKWTPAVSGVATIQTCGAGTNFDTALYVRSGSCSSGGEVGCNDDACANASGLMRASRITPAVTAGQTYYIVVDGYGGAQGTFALTVTAPGNVTTVTSPTTTTTTLGNRPPVANAGPDMAGTMGSPVSLTDTGSYDPDLGDAIVSYRWSFGDGTTATYTTAGIVAHTYSAAGTYTATLTVTDTHGAMSSDTALVTIATATASTGQFLRARQISPGALSDGARVNGVATDISGNVVGVGQVSDAVDFGGGVVPISNGGSGVWDDIFIAKYSSTNGFLWAKRFGTGGATSNAAYGVAVDSGGNIVVTGLFQGTVDFGGGPLVSAGGSQDIFVAKYGPTGTHLWSRRFGGGLSDVGNAIAVDGSGNVMVTGSFQSTVDFGAGSLTSAGGPDIFVLRLSGTDGSTLWARGVGGTSADVGAGIAVDSAGNVAVTGVFNNTVDFGSGPLTSAGGMDIFLVQYASSGTLRWAKRFGGSGAEKATAVAVDTSGNVVITGSFSSTADFGGGPLVNVGGTNVFLAKLSSTGSYLWAQQFGGDYTSDADGASGVAFDASGNVILTGTYIGGISFGGPFFGTASWDVFLAKFSPTGAHLWSKAFGGDYNDGGLAVAADRSGNVWAAGYFAQSANFGAGTLTSSNGVFAMDGYIAKFAP